MRFILFLKKGILYVTSKKIVGALDNYLEKMRFFFTIKGETKNSPDSDHPFLEGDFFYNLRGDQKQS